MELGVVIYCELNVSLDLSSNFGFSLNLRIPNRLTCL